MEKVRLAGCTIALKINRVSRWMVEVQYSSKIATGNTKVYVPLLAEEL